MLHTIDKSETHLIQKVTRPKDGTLIRYQTVPLDDLGNPVFNYEEVGVFPTLMEARQVAGKEVEILGVKPKPKKAVKKAA